MGPVAIRTALHRSPTRHSNPHIKVTPVIPFPVPLIGAVMTLCPSASPDSAIPALGRRQFLMTTIAGSIAGNLVWPCHSQATPSSRDRLKVLILSGQNNHDWKRTTPLMEQILLDSKRFEVTISYSPPAGAPAAAWDDWNPQFRDYDCLLSDYNGQLWPERIRDAFVEYIDGGGRLLIQHAANNPFHGWTDYERMAGLLWRGADVGYRVYLDEEEKVVRQGPGQGIGSGHGGLHDWPITTRAEDHPIFRDLPNTWMHAHDELYHGQRGPAEDMNILASSFSSRESGGTGQHELMVWWIPFGQGKALSLMPGHLWEGQEDTRAFRCVGFRTLLARATEWVASDQVTLPVPDNFPTAEKTVVLP